MRSLHQAGAGRRTPIILVVLAVLALAPAPARAQEGESVDDARRYLDLANEAFARKDYERALEYYRHANRLSPDPVLHFNMGGTLAGLGRNAEALDELDQFLAGAASAPDKLKTQARAMIERLEPLVGLIVVDANVDGASVELNQRKVGDTPLSKPLRVDPGAYTLSLSAPGHESFTSRVGVTRGKTVRVTATLEKLPAGPVGGASGPARRSFFARHRASTLMFAGGVVLAGAGLAMGGLTWRDYKDLAHTCAYTSAGCPQDDIDSVEQKALITNILIGTAAATAVTAAIVFLFVEDSAAESRGVAIVPTSSGASLLVRF